MRDLIAANAAELRVLHNAIHRAHREDRGGPVHIAACQTFRDRYDRLAFPGGLEQGLLRLKQLDAEAIAIAVEFLAADPWFFRSGYIKQEIVQRLKHAPLTRAQSALVRDLIRQSILKGTSHIPNWLATLAPMVATADFRGEVETAAQSSDVQIAARAERVMHCLRSAGSTFPLNRR